MNTLAHPRNAQTVEEIAEFGRRLLGKVKLPPYHVENVKDKESYQGFIFSFRELVKQWNLTDFFEAFNGLPNTHEIVRRFYLQPEGVEQGCRYRIVPRNGAGVSETNPPWVDLSQTQAYFFSQLGGIVMGKMQEPAKTLARKANASGILQILDHLKRTYDVSTDAEEMELHNRFQNGKYNSKTQDLRSWILDKFSVAERLRPTRFANDEQFERAMRSAILLNLPGHFSTIASQVKNDLPVGWERTMERLVDWETTVGLSSKEEKEGRVYQLSPAVPPNTTPIAMKKNKKKKNRQPQTANVSQPTSPSPNAMSDVIRDLQKEVSRLNQVISSQSSSTFGGGWKGKGKGGKPYGPMCYSCGKYGHLAHSCRKNGKKGQGWQDKGKGKGKKGPY